LYRFLVVGVIILFVSVGIQTAFANEYVKKSPLPISNGNTLYVGGFGEGNYTKIQDAIDDARTGDTVFVFDENSPYFEHLKVYKSINLIGENKTTTVIDGRYKDSVVIISCNGVTISGFTIQNSGLDKWFDAGIFIWDRKSNIICGNILRYNSLGILLRGVADKNIISDNTILYNLGGIALFSASYNIIRRNNIIKNDEGIHIDYFANEFMYPAVLNVILKNNFINNKLSASFEFGLLNRWSRNYWDGPRLLPKPIFGSILGMSWINFDWRPALKRHDIEVWSK
jgi:parallel beta-helix repeat protein